MTLNRFDWSNNYTAEAKIAGKTNVLEILDAARRGGYDALCLYAPGDAADAPSEEVLTALREYGFERLEAGKSYAGIVRSDNSVDQEGGEESVRVEAELGGTPVTLLVENGRGLATFGGVEYAAPRTGGLYLFTYDARNRAVLSQAYVDRSVEPVENPFEEYGDDPLRYLDLLENDDYITVMTVAGTGSRYMPGVVNDKLREKGLIPLDGEFNRPYIAVLDGSEVIRNEYGEAGTELNITCEVEGVSVSVVSSALPSGASAFIAIGDDAPVSHQNPGLTICVYSKSQQRRVSLNRFDWSNNYTAKARIAGKNNVLELLDAARRGAYDVLCLYVRGEADEAPDAEVLAALREYGFGQLDAGASYAGIVRSDGDVVQESGEEPVRIEAELGGTPVTLLVENGHGSAKFWGVEYPAGSDGVYLYVYDTQSRAVLTQSRVDRPEAAAEPFKGLSENPLEYLDALADDDFITVIYANASGSRFMPWVVNDKLSKMGLIPLDGTFDRPYIAVLDGAEVVANEYGQVGEEISVRCEVDGTEVVVISDAHADKRSGYISVGETEVKRQPSHVGPTFYVYSKSRKERISFARFDWSKDYLSRTGISGVDNPLELLTIARHGGYDVLCASNAASGEGEADADAMAMLRDFGFTELEGGAYYAGVLRGDGSVEQQSRMELASLELDLEGVPAALYAGDGVCRAGFYGAVEYASDQPGIHLYVYDPKNRAVLTEICYANK